jgi:hypothetical protein
VRIFKKILVALLIIGGVVALWLLKDKILDELLMQRADAKVMEAQDVINKNAEEEKLKQIEEGRIRNITQRKLLNENLHKSQKITVLEGTVNYTNVVPKQAFISWFNNNLNVELLFNFQIQYDTNDIQVLYIDNNIAKVKIDTTKEKFTKITALDTNKIKQEPDDDFLCVGYNAEDMNNILAIANKDAEESINMDNDVCVKSIESLKEFVVNMGQKFNLEIQFVESMTESTAENTEVQ